MKNSITPNASSPKLLDQVRDRIRVKHYSIRTETQYVQWIKRFILFHGKRHPREMGAAEVEAFLTHLAVAGKVATSIRNQAKCVKRWLNASRWGSFEWIRRAGVFKRRVFI